MRKNARPPETSNPLPPPLKEYRRKRDFAHTPEPEGEPVQKEANPLRFVVQKHRASHLHWDLRLELDGVLKSWAVPKGPTLDPSNKKLAMMVEDHPIDYQTFEGIIPEGNYGAGAVIVWDRGTYHSRQTQERNGSEEALRKGLAKGHITFILEGEKLKGEFALVKLRSGKENSWLLIKKKDEFAVEGDVPESHDASVVSGKDIEEIGDDEAGVSGIDLSGAQKAPMPTHVKPMAATLVDKPFNRPDWLFEIKWDGYRALAQISNGRIRLYSRNDKDLNERFSPVVDSLASLPFTAILDGELVVVDSDGRADLQLLQNYLRSEKGNLVYYVFDILYLNGHDLRDLPLLRRKSILSRVLPPLANVKISDHIVNEGLPLFEFAKENRIEGVVAKDGASTYKAGRRVLEWQKFKTHLQQEAVIGGFTEPRGGRKSFGSLVLGVYKDRKLTYIGHTGGGFSDKQLESLHTKLDRLSVAQSPFAIPPKPNMPVTWVKPQVVCEVRFSEWTDEGLMRHPIFLGLREDKDPKEIARETPSKVPTGDVVIKSAQASIMPTTSDDSASKRRTPELVIINDTKVKLTHLDKVFWPDEGYTKSDVIDYYREIAPFILPYLKGRPESLRRNPDGINGESFFQKNMNHKVPEWIETVSIRSEPDGKDTHYMICNDTAALIYMANLGCIEINPWHSHMEHLENPDYMVLDLDPLNIGFSEVVETALETRKVLEEAGASSYCKTSGAKGLHIYVPLSAKYTDDQAQQFAKLINVVVHQRLPDTTSMERSPAKRPGKVYLDYLQNGRGQTLVAPYCLRPRAHATASTPLTWDEVNHDLDPSRFTIRTLSKRLEKIGDLWKNVLGPGIDMERCLKRISVDT